ncbi:hypothetical protein LXL04_027511 [Taraxacum kok-saghyz]
MAGSSRAATRSTSCLTSALVFGFATTEATTLVFGCATTETTAVAFRFAIDRSGGSDSRSIRRKCVTTVVIYYSYTRYIGNTDSDTDIQYRQAASVFKEICTETSLPHATPNLLNRPHPVSRRLRVTDHWVNQQPRPGRIEPASLLGETCALTIRTTVIRSKIRATCFRRFSSNLKFSTLRTDTSQSTRRPNRKTMTPPSELQSQQKNPDLPHPFLLFERERKRRYLTLNTTLRTEW